MKRVLAKIFCVLGISDLLFYLLSKRTKNNYIRVINYHEVEKKDLVSFEKQLQYLSKTFYGCNYSEFKAFLDGKLTFNQKPGLLITFDDGFENNYSNALPLLEKYGFVAGFFLPCGLIDSEGYMSTEQIKELIQRGNFIGSHTFSHHRMAENDTIDTLQKEIVDSKCILEHKFGGNIDIFCWVGGEKGTYTKQAFQMIKHAGYRFSMMTDSFPVFPDNNNLTIQRTNIQTFWGIDIVKLQLSGFMDIKYHRKRRREERLSL